MTISTKLGYNAAILAARLICEGAKIEINNRFQGRQHDAQRLTVRGAALTMIRELYYSGLTEKAQEKLRRVPPAPGRSYYTGHDALLDLAGWADVP